MLDSEIPEHVSVSKRGRDIYTTGISINQVASTRLANFIHKVTQHLGMHHEKISEVLVR